MKKNIAVFMFICLSFALFADTSSKMLESWNRLSETEKWMCLLSEPLMEQNKLSITTVNPEMYMLGGSIGISQSLLENWWDLHSRDDVYVLVEKYRLKQAGETILFEETKAIFNQNPQISIKQIAIKECLECSSIVRLCVASEMQDALGCHGMLAWDYGRILAALRFGVAVGWLDEDEAVSLAKPFIEELKNAYASWEDYAAHYALGRMFYKNSAYRDSYEQPNVLECVKKYDIEVAEAEKGKIFTFHDIEFPGKNRKDNRILKYKDADFKFSNDTEDWIDILECQNDDDMFGLFGLPSFVENNLDIPALADIWIESKLSKLAMKKGVRLAVRYLFRHGFNGDFDENDIFYNEDEAKRFYKKFSKKLLKYYDKANPSFENVENKTDLYHQFYVAYALAAYLANDIDKMNLLISKLDEEKCDVSDYKKLHCIQSTFKAKEYAARKEYDNALEFAKKALDDFKNSKASTGNTIIDEKRIFLGEQELTQMIADYESKIETD